MKLTPLKRLRFERGLLQIDFANSVGIERSRMSLLENGHVRPRADELRRIAGALGVSIDALLAGDRD
jgi:transcriptional regulator with XRE-family HTH domain